MTSMNRLYEYIKFELKYQNYINTFGLSGTHNLPYNIYDIGQGDYTIIHNRDRLYLISPLLVHPWNVLVPIYHTTITCSTSRKGKGVDSKIYAWPENLNKLIYEYLTHKGLINDDNV